MGEIITESEAMEQASMFLEFCAANGERLRRNLRKNITFDVEIFEDVFADSIVKCYDSIVRRRVRIKSFENLIFLASKNNYIQAQNRRRKAAAAALPADAARETPHEEDDGPTAAERLESARSAIASTFGEGHAEIFMLYWAEKAEGGDGSMAAASRGWEHAVCRRECERMRRWLRMRTTRRGVKAENENELF